MNLYITFLYVNRDGIYIANGFSFGAEIEKDDVFLFFTNFTSPKKIQEEIQKYNPEKIFCSLTYIKHLVLIENLVDKRWVIGGPLVGSSYVQDFFKSTDATVFPGLFETYMGKEISGTFIPYFKDYLEKTYVGNQTIFYNATIGYGCYWRKCNFCSYKEFVGWTCDGVLERPNIRKMLDSLPELEKNDLRKLFVHTCMDSLTPNALNEVLSAKKTISYMSFVRADKPIVDVIKKYEDLSNQYFSIGIEAFSQRVIDILGKGIRIETALEMIDSITERGGMSSLNIMIGYPFLTKEDVEESFSTLDRIKQIMEKNKNGKIRVNNNLNIFWPEEQALKLNIPTEERGLIKIGSKEYRGNFFRSSVPRGSEQYQYNAEIMGYVRKCGIPLYYPIN